MSTARRLVAVWLGRRSYGPVHELQQRLADARAEGTVGDRLLLVEHPDVLTLGRAARAEHVLLSADELARRGYEVHEVGRGGDVTYHGPGQIVAYPIVDLKPDRQDVRRYVSTLEATMIAALRRYALDGARVAGRHGVWVGDRKIGAVGVRIRRWVTMHGLALNVTTDLRRFEAIVPCGIADREVTSIERETGTRPPVEEVGTQLAEAFAALWDAQLEWRASGSVDDAG